MNRILFVILLSGFFLSSCGKDDPVPPNPEPQPEPGRLNVLVSNYYYENPPMPTGFATMQVSLECDAAPDLTFDIGESLGLIRFELDVTEATPFYYSGSPLPMEWKDGMATATIYYVPLETGDHRITFKVSGAQLGKPMNDTRVVMLPTKDNPLGGFRPIPVWTADWWSSIAFRDELESWCDLTVAVREFNGAAEWGEKEIWIAGIYAQPGQFCPIFPAKWSAVVQDYDGKPILFEHPIEDSENTALLTFKDKFGRCKDMTLTFSNTKVEYSNSDYYLRKRE